MLKSGGVAENHLVGPGSNNYGRDEKSNFFSRKDHGGFDGEFLKEELKKANKNMRQGVKMVDGFPRRNRLDLCTLAELAITNAVNEVEKMAADVRLTEAVILLGKARDMVSDFIDNN